MPRAKRTQPKTKSAQNSSHAVTPDALTRLERISPLVRALFFLIGIPLVLQFLYAWMGFNPTDDGFILAYSRRVLNGQIPHLDFISIRPAGSAYLHLTELGAGDYTIWFSRLVVWFQLTCIVWTWMQIFARRLQLRLTVLDEFVFVTIGLALSAHSFPLMVWHTIDALFLSSLGALLATIAPTRAKWVGYFLIGAAYLCKQNFLLVAPAALFLLGDARNWRAWLALAVPGLVYVGYLGISGALPAAINQLGAQTELQKYGIDRFVYYIELRVPLLLGALAMLLAFGVFGSGALKQTLRAQWVLGALLAVYPIYRALVALPGGNFTEAPVFELFGATLGAVLFFLLPRVGHWDSFRFGLLALLIVWASAISIGYNTPALGAGILAIVLVAYIYRSSNRLPYAAWQRWLPLSAGLVLVCVGIFQFNTTRQTLIYREQPAQQLTAPLDGILIGGRGIKTNSNTAAFLQDLNTAISQTNGTRYAIVPDLAAYWVQAPHPNPLPIDWTLFIELNNPLLIERVTGALNQERGSFVIIAQKVQAESLAQGFFPFANPAYSPIANAVRKTFQPLGATRFFELYH